MVFKVVFKVFKILFESLKVVLFFIIKGISFMIKVLGKFFKNFVSFKVCSIFILCVFLVYVIFLGVFLKLKV